MKTIKQIADEIGISKQRVYRYVKAHCISEAHQRSGVMYFDEAVETQIRQAFEAETVSSEAHHEAHQKHITDAVSDTFSEVEFLREQVRELTTALKNEQLLNAGLQRQLALAPSQVSVSESVSETHEQDTSELDGKRKWWQFWR